MSDLNNGLNVGLIKDLREQYGFSPSKALGQNFLIDANISKKIASNVQGNVLEIGPGLGSLTIFLSQVADQVIAVEYDKHLLTSLQWVLEKFDANNVEIINKDIMLVDIEKLCVDNNIETIAGNLPYNISAPLLLDIAAKTQSINTVIAMVQTEVAQRLCAEQRTRNVSSATLKLQFFMDTKILFNVSPKAFYPQPNVDSSVIRLERKKTYSVDVDADEIIDFFNLIDVAFSQRRKMLRKSLIPLFGDLGSQIFETAGIDPTVRPEHCGLEEFARIFRAYKEIK